MSIENRRLIEDYPPIKAISKEASREKSVRQGDISALHLWWARRPLAACRALLSAQLVDDPLAHPDKFPTEEDQKGKRERLFKIIEEMGSSGIHLLLVDDPVDFRRESLNPVFN